MDQMTIFDLIEAAKCSEETQAVEVELGFNDEEIRDLRHEFLIATVKVAFGISRGAQRPKPNKGAMDWIFSGDLKHPFSFHNACLENGADPEEMRDWLLYYKRKLLN